MSFLSRLTRLFDSTRSSAKRRASRTGGLSLELLEERWTPAIDVFGAGTDAVAITDTNAGQTSNSIQIIDDLSTHTTYIKINNGKEVQLGGSGVLLHNLTIDLGAGNDKLSFVTRGEGDYDGNLNRLINLGSGNDSLTIDFGEGRDMHDSAQLYRLFGDTTGNDSYTVRGEFHNGALFFDAAAGGDVSGNDSYKFDVRAQGAPVQLSVADFAGNDKYSGAFFAANAELAGLDVTDVGGNDSYAFTVGSSGVGLFSIGLADAFGSDSYKLISNGVSDGALQLKVHDASNSAKAESNSLTFQHGVILGASQFVDLEFTGQANNKITIHGDATVLGSSEITYVGGEGRDTVAINDNSVSGEDALAFISVQTHGGVDKVTLQLDGQRNTDNDAIASAAAENVFVALGEGNDSFFAGVDGRGFSLASNNLGATSFLLNVLGEAGDDKLTYKSTSSAAVKVLGDQAGVLVALVGGEGNDVISLNVGNFASPSGSTIIAFTADGGLGADKLSFAGTLSENSPNASISFGALLGSDSDKDSFKSTLHAAKKVIFSSANVFVAAGFVNGVDSLSLAKEVNAAHFQIV